MNIAFVSAIMPYPLHSGGQVRIYNLLKHLSAKHDITLYAFIREESEKKYLEKLDFCKKVIPIFRGRAWQLSYIFASLISNFPFLFSTYRNVYLQKLLQDELDSFDLIHIEPGYVFPSLPKHINIPIVVSEHNIEHTVYKGFVNKRVPWLLQPFFMQDIKKMQRWEKLLWNTASSVVTVSNDDKLYISEHATPKKISVVPNGVDIDFFRYGHTKRPNTKSLTFLYVGNFSWMQNTDAVEHILTDIWDTIIGKFPGAQFTIVGKHFPISLRKKCSNAICIKDSVDDIREEYNNADALLAPVRIGGGTRYKVLESMAVGLPVITSTLGASGLGVEHKKEIYIADTPDDIVNSINELMSESARKKLVLRARSLIESTYSWDRISEALDDCWKSV